MVTVEGKKSIFVVGKRHGMKFDWLVVITIYFDVFLTWNLYYLLRIYSFSSLDSFLLENNFGVLEIMVL